jgi:integration host factor subunit beta
LSASGQSAESRRAKELKVTKKEIVKEISDKLQLTQLKTKEIVQQTFDAIIDTLVEEERIELRNFGVFEVKQRAARKARNPRTGAKVEVPAKFVVTFKPGKEMEEKVQRLVTAHRAAKAGGKNSIDAKPMANKPPRNDEFIADSVNDEENDRVESSPFAVHD